jgi:hypothetical protein
MKPLKRSPEELEADRLEFDASRQERKKVGLRAVEEMSKHPLSLEQKREQAKQLREAADRHEKRSSRSTRK